MKFLTGKKRLAGLSITLLVLSLLMSSCDIQDDRSNENKRLLNTDRQFAAMSVEQGAAEAFKYYLTEEALALSDGEHPTLGREAIYASMKSGQEYTLAWEPQRAEVSSSGDMGWT
jgi:hypothetical protein